MLGTIYKYLLDRLRSIDQLTYFIWGFRIHTKLMAVTWDLTSIVLKKAIDTEVVRNDLYFLDMGCGQVALLGQYFKITHPSAAVMSVDLYGDIIECAQENIVSNQLVIELKRSDLFDNVQGQYDLISFNPPYVSLSEQRQERYMKIRYGGVEGTETINSFLTVVRQFLNPNGLVFLGINCFYVPETKCLELARLHNFQVKNIIRRKFNSSIVLVLT